MRRFFRAAERAEPESRPLLAVDVDGVIIPLGRENPVDSTVVQMELIDGMIYPISQAAGLGLRRLAEQFELVWATGWEARANQRLPDLLGIPELPHISFDGAARFGSAHWKLGPLEAFSKGRPVAWVDDSFNDACRRWAQEREAPTMLVPVEPHRGLEEAHVEILLDWAQSLA